MEALHEILSDENLALMKQHIIFSGLDESEIITFIRRSKPEYIEVDPMQKILLEPGDSRRLGVVISGDVKIFSIDYDGNRSIIHSLSDDGSIGTLQFMLEHYNMMFEIHAATAGKIILFSPDSLLITDEENAVVQHKVLVNLMASQRLLFVNLSQRLVCLSQKSIREKLLKYFQICSENARSYEFDIKLSREELALYLAVDRASLSRSLGQLKRESIIDFKKNHFKILTTQHFQYYKG